MMRSILQIAFFSLFLTACQLRPVMPKESDQGLQLFAPEMVEFQGRWFEKVNHSQIDEMQQLLYLPSESRKDPNQWEKGILIFLDKNSEQKTLADRVALRQKAFAKQLNTDAKIKVVKQGSENELQSAVIYPPTERFNDVLLEVSRGRNLRCGYGQIQISDKRSVFVKKMPNLTAYQAELAKLAFEFNQVAWQICCK